MICVSCKKNEAVEWEEIGEGKYCQDCLDREEKIWMEESGFIQEDL